MTPEQILAAVPDVVISAWDRGWLIQWATETTWLEFWLQSTLDD